MKRDIVETVMPKLHLNDYIYLKKKKKYCSMLLIKVLHLNINLTNYSFFIFN